jgi:uncharacterized protein
MATPNKHVWYELITNDQDGAEKFYSGVMGWNLTDSGMPGMRYTIINAGDVPIGGMMSMENGPPPVWLGYVGVDDVDAYAAKVKQLGGSVHKGPEDIPGVGRFAVVTDPQATTFVLFKGAPNDGFEPNSAPYMTVGTFGWHELHSTDWEADFAFYSALFGWTKDQAMDMGPMGTYQLFAAGDHAIGGMMNSPNLPHPMWLYYVSVDDIDAAKQRAEAGGAKIMIGPEEVPGPMWIIQATDPQGAMFAMVGPRK